jgi:hypothetical protein
MSIIHGYRHLDTPPEPVADPDAVDQSETAQAEGAAACTGSAAAEPGPAPRFTELPIPPRGPEGPHGGAGAVFMPAER